MSCGCAGERGRSAVVVAAAACLDGAGGGHGAALSVKACEEWEVHSVGAVHEWSFPPLLFAIPARHLVACVSAGSNFFVLRSACGAVFAAGDNTYGEQDRMRSMCGAS